MATSLVNAGASSTSAPSSSEPSFMQELLNSGNEGSVSSAFEGSTSDGDVDSGIPEDPSVQEPGVEGLESTPPASTVAQDVIDRIAEKTGLDPKVASQRQAIENLAASQKFMAGLEAQPDVNGGLTEFERSLMEQEEPGQPVAPAQAAQPGATQPAAQPLPPGKYGDIGDTWATPEDSIKALSAAYIAGDSSMVHQIEQARFARFADGMIVPYMKQYVENALKPFMGIQGLVPQLHQQAQEAQYQNNRAAAISDLTSTPGYENIADLSKEEEGEPVMFDGNAYPNTPFNRIVAQHPYIRDIRVSHKDPAVAQRLTLIQQWRAVHKQHQQSRGSVAPEQVKGLVKAGAEMGRREATDITRQRINSGTGATSRGGGPAPKSLMQELTQPGQSFSISDIFASQSRRK